MVTLTFLRFLKLIFASVAFVAIRVATRLPKVIEINKGNSTLGLEYASFKKEPFYHLNITCLGADLLDSESECGFACLETPSCFSYNVAAFPDINGKHFCGLLPSDMYNYTEKLIPTKGHHHFSMASQCSSWPCKNKGKCVSLYEENSYVCVCEDGFTGKTCETNVNECQSNPCLNNGTCVDMINGFNCSCPPGFVGDRCQTDVNECQSNPCLNNGTCVDMINGFNCTCPPGLVGNHCQTDVNECQSNPCLNNGTCVDMINGFNCTCPPGFAGDRCQTVGEIKDSVIVGNNEAHLTNLSEWLKPVVQSGHIWKLCWRASRDGWAGTTFHSMCDNKGPTVTIVKTGNYIFGGYTSISWGSNCLYRSDSKAFLFSLVNKPGWDPVKLPQPGQRDNSYSYSTYSCSSYGPTFGNGHDLYVSNRASSSTSSYTNLGHSYSPPPGNSFGTTFTQTFLSGGSNRNFQPSEVETYYESK